MVHRVTKAATCFFLLFSSCFSLKFFSVVVFLFVHRDAKEAFSLFPFSSFFFAFCVVFLFACFFFSVTQY